MKTLMVPLVLLNIIKHSLADYCEFGLCDDDKQYCCGKNKCCYKTLDQWFFWAVVILLVIILLAVVFFFCRTKKVDYKYKTIPNHEVNAEGTDPIT